MKNRKEIQQIALERAKDAQVLLKNGCFSGAYYMAGYVVECGLKACFAKTINKFDYPDKDKINKIHVHKIKELIEHSGLSQILQNDRSINNNLDKNWSVVMDWNEKCRYIMKNQNDAEDLFNAIFSKKDGVLSWLKSHW